MHIPFLNSGVCFLQLNFLHQSLALCCISISACVINNFIVTSVTIFEIFKMRNRKARYKENNLQHLLSTLLYLLLEVKNSDLWIVQNYIFGKSFWQISSETQELIEPYICQQMSKKFCTLYISCSQNPLVIWSDIKNNFSFLVLKV